MKKKRHLFLMKSFRLAARSTMWLYKDIQLCSFVMCFYRVILIRIHTFQILSTLRGHDYALRTCDSNVAEKNGRTSYSNSGKSVGKDRPRAIWLYNIHRLSWSCLNIQQEREQMVDTEKTKRKKCLKTLPLWISLEE